MARVSRRLRRGSSERGASLVEIMVVLVILLIGVFLAIRIFPTGFGTLRASENRTGATRLAERLMSLAKGDAAENLPQGVLPAYADLNTQKLVVDTSQDPDDLTLDRKAVRNPYFEDINRFRYIKGEQIKVPLPTAGTLTSDKIGSYYTVKFGPMYMAYDVGNVKVGLRDSAPSADGSQDGLYSSFLSVRGAALTPIRGESRNGVNAARALRGPQTYIIDYGGDEDGDGAAIMFAARPVPNSPLPPRARAFRTFRASFSYEDDDDNFETATGIIIEVADGATPTWQQVRVRNPSDKEPDPPYARNILPGSITVTREFDRIGYQQAWDTDDPYQYKLASDNLSDESGTIFTDANIGALMFNPAGANYSEQTPYGQRAFTAFVDYAVLDWHIIRDDIEVPSVSTGTSNLIPIRTTLYPIKESGDPQPDLSVYYNIFRDPNPGNATDLVVVNLSNPGSGPLKVGSYRKPETDDDILVDYNPRGGSYRTGTLYVNTSRVPRGSQLRVLYQAEGDWAVALQKAYEQYQNPMPRINGVPTPIERPVANAYDQFGIDGQTAGTRAVVYFPGCDLGKSVTLSIQFQDQNSEWHRLDPIQVTLDTPEYVTRNGQRVLGYASAELNPSGVGKSYIPLLQQDAFNNRLQWRVSGPNGIGVAYGSSVKARVIWHDTGQTDATTSRWRVQELDSNLTPSP